MSLRPEHERGFTIQEMLVTLIAGSLLLSFSLSLLLFVSGIFSSWQRGAEVRRTAHRVIHLLLTDMRHAESVRSVGDSELVLVRHDGRTVRYKFTGGVFRDTLSLIPPDGPAVAMSVKGSYAIEVCSELKGRRCVVGTETRLANSSQSSILRQLEVFREVPAWGALKRP